MNHIDSLPPEILSCIFYTLLETIKSSSITYDVCRPPNLIDILLVSSHWNRVATSSPALWSYIAVTNQDGIDIESVTRLVERDLLRSKECSLDVVIKVRANLGDKLESLLAEVVRQAHRWRTLYIRALTAKAIEILEQAHLPRLLSVSYVGSFRGLSLKLDAPHLKHFRSPIGNSNSFTFRDPLPTLTHLDYALYPNTSIGFLKHLRHSQHTLTTLGIRCYIRPGTQLEVHSEYRAQGSSNTLFPSFPALTEYRVSFQGSDWDWNAFKIGHLPHLRKLDIRWLSSKDAPPNTISFMPQLLTLIITAVNPHTFENAATTLLAAAPNLERLCLCQHARSAYARQESWLSPLLRGEQDSEAVACPRLVVLRLRKIIIPRLDHLRKIGSRRPAFKSLVVDSVCWEKIGGENQDFSALRQCFDIVVDDEPDL